jgi:hypothetical protein
LGGLLARLHSLPVGGEVPAASSGAEGRLAVPESGYRPEQNLPGLRDALRQVDSFIGEAGPLTPREQRAIVPELLELIERFPSFDRLPRGIIHSDPYFVNLIETPAASSGVEAPPAVPANDLYLIDWEDGGVSYPLLDVGYVLAHLVTFTPRDRAVWGVPGPESGPNWRPDWGREFLDAYQAVRPLTAEEQRLLPDAIRLNFMEYIPNWGTSELILDNYLRMKMVEEEN